MKREENRNLRVSTKGDRCAEILLNLHIEHKVIYLCTTRRKKVTDYDMLLEDWYFKIVDQLV